MARLSPVGFRQRAWIFGILMLLVASFGSQGVPTPTYAANAIWYVDANASGSNNGTSWANAFTNLQSALAAAAATDQIWVADGIYYPSTSDRSASFQLKNGVAIYGGFAGSETALSQRDWESNPTILSGDIDQNDPAEVLTDASQIAGSNSYHVVTGNSVNSTASLDGFTITAGQANETNPHNRGGGMHIYSSSSPILSNISFAGNAASYGGGLFNDGGSPILTNVTFAGNSASSGGGLYNYTNSNSSLSNVSFSRNKAELYGGGMYNDDSISSLTNVTFAGNSAYSGGGMANDNSTPNLTNVSFSWNSASYGGGMHNNVSDPILTNVSFSGNNASSSGGGMYNATNSSPTLRNSILWGNNSTIANVSSSSTTISYSLVQGCNPGGTWNTTCGTDSGNNLADTDPLFMTAIAPADAPTTSGDLRLQVSSPALNAGNSIFNPTTTDLAGNPRHAGSAIDLGAYETQPIACPASGVLYVDTTATGANTGTGWADAIPDLQEALILLTGTCDIWVAEGVYTPTSDASNRTATFQLKNGVAIYGGFAGTETALTQRDWQTNLTILSGDIDQNDPTDVLTDASQIAGSNSYHVVTGSGTDATASLDGFMITAGQANGASPHNYGGGMYNTSGSNPSLSNVSFSGNAASNGGGMYNNSSNPSLSNVSFSGNAASNGGGMYNNSSNPSLSNVSFSGNTVSFNGGGIANNSSSNPSLSNVSFSGNTASFGGGMYNANSSPSLTNVTFAGNAVTTYGGGMYNTSSSPSLTNVAFAGNAADFNGGGMYNTSSSPGLTNVAFVGNDAAYYGGGMYNNTSSPSLTNLTFSGNDATNGGGMYNNTSSHPTFRNSILWGNSSSIYNSSSTPTISYSLVEGCNEGGTWDTNCGTDGDHNLTDADPLFVSPINPANAPTTSGDLRLLISSAAIDVGDSSLNSTPTDLDGNPRLAGAAIDLGAYEYSPNTAPIANAGPNQTVIVGAHVSLDGSASSDADGDLPLSYSWTQTSGPSVGLSDASAAQPSFTAPSSPATLTFALVVTDSMGLASSVDSVTISVSDVAISGLNADSSSPTTLDQTTSFTATISAGSNVTYSWDFGDGTTGSGANPSHTYAEIGTYTVTVTATNSRGSVSASTAVHVTPDLFVITLPLVWH